MGFSTFRGFPLVSADRTSRYALPLMSFHACKSTLPIRAAAEAAVASGQPTARIGSEDLRRVVRCAEQYTDTSQHRGASSCPPTTSRTEVRELTERRHYSAAQHPIAVTEAAVHELSRMDWCPQTPKRLHVREPSPQTPKRHRRRLYVASRVCCLHTVEARLLPYTTPPAERDAEPRNPSANRHVVTPKRRPKRFSLSCHPFERVR